MEEMAAGSEQVRSASAEAAAIATSVGAQVQQIRWDLDEVHKVVGHMADSSGLLAELAAGLDRIVQQQAKPGRKQRPRRVDPDRGLLVYYAPLTAELNPP
ncbi:MAG TPA: hypothetical protein VD973_18845 [Symbiobacteriaceae bacterium]|jgi:ABC-type transporter Mla subunit MlaD|nr:hypothetical protein [Symbiobacteriaceae bacterium]